MKYCWTTITVNDLEKSLKFYHDLLGLGPVTQFGPPDHRIAMMGEDGAPKLELIAIGSTEHAGDGVSVGYECDDLDATVATLKANGLAVSDFKAPNDHIRFCFVKDPDGYTVQLLEQH